MSDQKLFEALKKGDERAFEIFYREYKNKLFSFIRSKISNKEDAQEILNRVFFEFFEALRDFRGDSSLETYLFSIARHKIIDYYRAKKIKRVFLSKVPEELIKGLQFVLDEEIERVDLQQRIEKTLRKLPNDYKRILRLKYIEGLKVKKIAEKLKMSFKATESLLFRARKAFVKVFEKE